MIPRKHCFTTYLLARIATLGDVLTDICKEAGIAKKTNHSLWVTGTTVMFAAGVLEKMIKEVTALQIYERPCNSSSEASTFKMFWMGHAVVVLMQRWTKCGEKKITKTGPIQQYAGASFMGRVIIPRLKQLYSEHFSPKFPCSLSSGSTTLYSTTPTQ